MIETLSPTPSDSQPAAAPANDPPAQSGTTPGAGTPPAQRPAILTPLRVAMTVVVVVLGWAYAPNLWTLVGIWEREPNYSHGFLVLPVALAILWRRWTDGPPPRLAPWSWGWLALGAVLIFRAACYERGADWTETATLLPAIACLTLTAGGWPLLRRVWPAIAFLVFLLPLPLGVNGLLSLPLQRLATVSSAAILKLTGLWVVTEGNVILIGADQLEVATACNGLSMLMTLAATVAAMTALVPMDLWKRVALLASIVPVALLSNVLRIVATAWCYHLFGAQVGGHFAHDAAGWLMMPLALVLVGLELGLLSWLVIEEEIGPVARPDRLFRQRPI